MKIFLNICELENILFFLLIRLLHMVYLKKGDVHKCSAG